MKSECENVFSLLRPTHAMCGKLELHLLNMREVIMQIGGFEKICNYRFCGTDLLLSPLSGQISVPLCIIMRLLVIA